jgi:thioredoxin-dependent adenylylsulfate APS reductase
MPRRVPRRARFEVPQLSAPQLHSVNPLQEEVLRVLSEDATEDRSAEEILTWSVKNFHPRLSLAASFGGLEAMVVLDMMHRIDPGSRVFVLDTGRLPQATHDLIDRVRDRYDKAVEGVFPKAGDVQKMVAERGVNLFYESLEYRQMCCRLRKVEPMRHYLSDVDAYVSGLRRDQTEHRRNTRKVEIDRAAGGIVKINPLADWSREQVEQYIDEFQVPVNRLHAEGYPSVGCEPCSRAIESGEDSRAGRWWWERDGSKECGIHVDDMEGGGGI